MEMLKNIYQKLTVTKILLIGLIARLISWPWVYHGDINALYWWGRFAVDFGWRGFYDWLNFGGHSPPDQPMINIYYDWLMRLAYLLFYKIFWFFNINVPLFPSKFMQWYFDYGNQYLLKIPMIAADILLIYFCYRLTKSKAIALIVALFPPLIFNSAVWGSGDSIITLLALLSVYYCYKKRYFITIIFYLSSILFKPSLLIWSPIFLIILYKNKISFKNILFSFLFFLGLIYLISFPFNPIEVNPLIWFYKTMSLKILPGYLDLVTANAMNFWALLFGFIPKIDSQLIFNVISYRLLSTFACFMFYIFLLFKLIKNYSFKNLLLTLVTFTLVTFTFMTRMHERYTFPALIPLLLLCHYDRRFIKYFIILSITHMINVYIVYPVPNITFLIAFFTTDILIIRFLSLINVLVTLKLVFIDPNIVSARSHHQDPPPPKIS